MTRSEWLSTTDHCECHIAGLYQQEGLKLEEDSVRAEAGSHSEDSWKNDDVFKEHIVEDEDSEWKSSSLIKDNTGMLLLILMLVYIG